MKTKNNPKPVIVLHDENKGLPESALRCLIEFMEAHREEIEEGMRREKLEACQNL